MVRCPDIRLPDDHKSSSSSSGRKRGRSSDSEHNHLPVGLGVGLGLVSSKDVKDEIRGLLGDIKGLTATSFVGLKKKKFKDDKLTKLGAPDVKQQKMPFKMKMGIEAGKARRQKAVQSQAKEAGIVLATHRKAESDSRGGLFTKKKFDLGDRVSKGVLHINKSGYGSGSGSGRRR